MTDLLTVSHLAAMGKAEYEAKRLWDAKIDWAFNRQQLRGHFRWRKKGDPIDATLDDPYLSGSATAAEKTNLDALYNGRWATVQQAARIIITERRVKYTGQGKAP